MFDQPESSRLHNCSFATGGDAMPETFKGTLETFCGR